MVSFLASPKHSFISMILFFILNLFSVLEDKLIHKKKMQTWIVIDDA